MSREDEVKKIVYKLRPVEKLRRMDLLFDGQSETIDKYNAFLKVDKSAKPKALFYAAWIAELPNEGYNLHQLHTFFDYGPDREVVVYNVSAINPNSQPQGALLLHTQCINTQSEGLILPVYGPINIKFKIFWEHGKEGTPDKWNIALTESATIDKTKANLRVADPTNRSTLITALNDQADIEIANAKNRHALKPCCSVADIDEFKSRKPDLEGRVNIISNGVELALIK